MPPKATRLTPWRKAVILDAMRHADAMFGYYCAKIEARDPTDRLYAERIAWDKDFREKHRAKADRLRAMISEA